MQEDVAVVVVCEVGLTVSIDKFYVSLVDENMSNKGHPVIF